MNDEYLIRELFSHEEIIAYKKIREFQQKIGSSLEDYINTFEFSKDIRFIGRDKNRIVTNKENQIPIVIIGGFAI